MSANRRWWLWLTLLAATIAAALYPTDVAEPVRDASPAELRSAVVMPPPVASAKPVVAIAADATSPLPKLDQDPFAVVDWQAPPPKPQAVPMVAAPLALPPPVPQEPAMPYRFMGRLKEEGGEPVIYLARGQDTVIARVGDKLDAQYTLVAVEERKLRIEYLPLNHIHDLPIEAP